MDLISLYDVSNEQVVWTIGIAMYIYLSGMSAGSFLLGASADAFGKEKYRPLAKMGVVSALLLLAIAPIFLILDLSQPTRAYYTLLYPNPTSVVSWGVFLLSVYGLVCAIYAWFLFRPNVVKLIDRIPHISIRGLFQQLLKLGGMYDLDEATMARDRRWTKVIAIVGTGLALGLAGYTGFILAVVAARGMWHSAMIPVLFLFSALVSGTALLLILLVVKERYFSSPGERVDPGLVQDLGVRLRHLFLEDVAFLVFWLMTLHYSGVTGRDSLWLLTEGPYQDTFLGVQVLIGSLIPLLIIYSRYGETPGGLVTAAFLILVGIAAMRYNIVIGGQALPMSRGELVEYTLAPFEAVVTITIFLVLGLLFLVALRVLPLGPPYRPTTAGAGTEGDGQGEVYQGGPGGGGGGGFGINEPAGAMKGTVGRENDPSPLPEAPQLVPDGLGDIPEVSRRDFIKTGATAMVLLTFGGLGPRTLTEFLGLDSGGSGKRYAMVINLDKCVGCHACTQGCKTEHNVPSGVWRSWVKKLRKTRGDTSRNYYLPRLCNQCDKPPCVPVCPVRATYRDGDGIIRQRDDRCIGCKYCIVACPYSARFVHPGKEVVDKCDFCHDRVTRGRQPACVEACPTGSLSLPGADRARVFGDLNDPSSEISKLVALHPMHTMKADLGTKPMVLYKGADEQIMKGGLF